MSTLFKCLNLNIGAIFYVITLSVCSDNSAQQAVIDKGVAMESSNECYLCGMLITNFDGLKGEVFRKN
ncbi:MAG: copper chaperone NosL [Colwellia sp.]|jgi:copper chaperone NosL